MKLQGILLAALACLASTPAFAKSWSGFLVDSTCYAAEERSVNPEYIYNHTYRDTDQEIRVCSPNARTKSFSIVGDDGFGLRLDPAGNAKAAEIVQQTGKKNRLEVTVTGETSKDAIEVDSLALVERSEK
jgi:hypothetical protein